MPEVVMPRLSDSMEEGTIVRWLKQDGERVSEGEPLAEVETDKATVTFDADAEGTLHILVGEGETVPIGKPIAQIGEAPVPVSVPVPASVPAPVPGSTPSSAATRRRASATSCS
jgi:pyruvate dehydrogenase E2 component (dihydrolipoamide acetyltransferase)